MAYSTALAALCSLGAAAIHFAVAPEHFEEWWGYGLFFLTIASFQSLYAVGLLASQVWNERVPWYRLIGIFANLLIIGTYVVTRTTGIPWLGPEAGEVEAVGVPDVVSKSLELMLVLFLISGLSPISRRNRVAFSIGSRARTKG